MARPLMVTAMSLLLCFVTACSQRHVAIAGSLESEAAGASMLRLVPDDTRSVLVVRMVRDADPGAPPTELTGEMTAYDIAGELLGRFDSDERGGLLSLLCDGATDQDWSLVAFHDLPVKTILRGEERQTCPVIASGRPTLIRRSPSPLVELGTGWADLMKAPWVARAGSLGGVDVFRADSPIEGGAKSPTFAPVFFALPDAHTIVISTDRSDLENAIRRARGEVVAVASSLAPAMTLVPNQFDTLLLRPVGNGRDRPGPRLLLLDPKHELSATWLAMTADRERDMSIRYTVLSTHEAQDLREMYKASSEWLESPEKDEDWGRVITLSRSRRSGKEAIVWTVHLELFQVNKGVRDVFSFGTELVYRHLLTGAFPIGVEYHEEAFRSQDP